MSRTKHFDSQSVSERPDATAIPDFAALAKSLQEIAQALLPFSQERQIAVNAFEDCQDASKSQAGSLDADKPTGEIRCYRLPSYIVREEREILAKYKAEDFTAVLSDVYEDIYTTALLMRNFDESNQLDGFKIQMLAEHLLRPLDVLNKACALFADFDLVQVTPVD